MDKLKNFFALTVAALLPVILYIVDGVFDIETIPTLVRYTILFAVSVIFTWIFYFLLPNILFLSCPRIRKLVDPLAKFEGIWVCLLQVDKDNNTPPTVGDDARVCGFYKFFFDRYRKRFIHSGENYDRSGNIVTKFNMASVHYSAQINGFTFSGTATRNVNSITEKINCWGEISFVEVNGKTINSATGFFVNNCKEIKRVRTIIARIPKGVGVDFEQPLARMEYAMRWYKNYILAVDKIKTII